MSEFIDNLAQNQFSLSFGTQLGIWECFLQLINMSLGTMTANSPSHITMAIDRSVAFSVAVKPSPLLSVKSNMGTFGQESPFPLWPGYQRVPWPDRRSTADQTWRVPLEWHLEPLQGMRAPTDLQSSRQHDSLSGLKERKKEVLSTGMVWARSNEASPHDMSDPRAFGEVMVQSAFVRMLKFSHNAQFRD